jgi:single-stranded-DNA-specific exonuclease
MQYKLIGKGNTANAIQTILNNRGIEDWKQYINLTTSYEGTYKNLASIDRAVELFDKHFQAKNPIGILSDCDVDGQCSAALMYKYIKSLDPNYDVRVFVHQRNKSHGLADKDFDIGDIKLFIVPDAGTNDLEEHALLVENGVSCIITDHHHASVDTSKSPAIIINNQISPLYPNKDCCGTAITLEFCRALDEFYWEEISNNFLDLAAVANVCDIMNLTNFETRAVVNEGLNSINNKMIKQIIETQEFSMKGKVNPFTVGFYVGPLINAFIRLATYEERQLLIKAFCEIEDETFSYTKRGQDFPTEENIYEHVARLMVSYKGKQDRQKKKALPQLIDLAGDNTDKVAMIDATGIIDTGLTGVVAIKVAEELNAPTLLLQKRNDNVYGGSGRNFDNSPIEDFRALVDSCPYVDWANGHAGAFGFNVSSENVELAREWFNQQLKDIAMDKVYLVDFILDTDELDVGFIQTIDQYNWLWGTGIKEPKVAIENISIQRKDLALQGKNFDSVTFTVNDIKYVQFKLTEGDPLYDFVNEWTGSEDDWIAIDVVGECSLNEYGGVYTPQVIINNCRRRE